MTASSRVLLVTDFFPPVRGGLEFHVDALAGELSERGHEVHVATLTRNPQPSDPRVTVHTVPASAWALPHQERDRPFHPPLADPLARMALTKLIAGLQPDVVHGHNLLALSLPKRAHRNWPLVYTAHDYGLSCHLRTLLTPDLEICRGPALKKCIACGIKAEGVLRSLPLSLATPRGRKSLDADVIVAVSNSVRKALDELVDCPVITVPNFVGRGVVPVDPGQLPADFVLYAGDPGAHKGIFVLLDIWRAERPHVDLVLACTKPFSGDLPAGVSTRQMSRGQVLWAMRRARALLIPSLWHEPCPTVALEALSVGTPVVASAVGGLVDIVTDGVDGFLVAPGDAACLAAKIRTLADDAELNARMSLAATRRARDFDLGVIAEQLELCYDRAVGAQAAKVLVSG